MDDFTVSLGKSYWRINLLVEINHDTGESTTVDYASYPAKQEDWLLVRHKKKQKPKQKELVKDKIKNITEEINLW